MGTAFCENNERETKKRTTEILNRWSKLLCNKLIIIKQILLYYAKITTITKLFQTHRKKLLGG